MVDAELMEPEDASLNAELLVGERSAKQEIRRMEAEVTKWQVLVDKVTGSKTAEFDNQTLAVLRGRLVRSVHFSLSLFRTLIIEICFIEEKILTRPYLGILCGRGKLPWDARQKII